MIASAHLGAGLVAGMVATRAPGKPWARIVLALALGLASHVVLDAIPHSDYGYTPRRVILEIAICETVVVLSMASLILRERVDRSQLVLLAAGLFGSAVPDVHISRAFLPQSMWPIVMRPVFWFHGYFHHSATVFWKGMVVQLAAAVACMALLFGFPRQGNERPDSRSGG